MRRFAPLILAALPFAGAVAAQDAATLMADSVSITADNQLIASGIVEAFFDGTTLSAARITYDEATDRLIINGPIFIKAADGTILTADSADLDPKLQNGLLLSARMVLNEQLQLAANRIDRVDGRLTQLTKVAATSCNVCDGRPPLWDIRASRIVHDQDAKELYLDNAVLRVRGVPVFWLPTMRLPDPTLDRATGFLAPSYQSNNLLGLGVRTPYFIKIGDHRDLTLTPFLSAETRTLEARYRQAYLNGDIEINAAVSRDTIDDGATRGYVEYAGDFALPRDYSLSFNGIVTSHDEYLAQYGYSSADYLKNALTVARIEPQSFVMGEVAIYHTVKDGETDADIIPVVISVSTQKQLNYASSVLTTGIDADLQLRYGHDNTGADRDVFRIGAYADWNRNWVRPSGIVIESDLGIAADVYGFNNDPANDTAFRLVPSASVTLRYPMARTERDGSVNLLEPLLMLGWSDIIGDTVPNEDSGTADFDEANLFSLSRFPGDDRVEKGAQAAYGISWLHIAPQGWNARLLIGQVVRDEPAEFSASSGLSGLGSDFLLGGQLSLANGLHVHGRTLIDADWGAGKSELGVGWANDRIDLTAEYLWLPADLGESRTEVTSEWALDAGYIVNDNWNIGFNGRYDIDADSPVDAEILLGWQNECVKVEFSASRSYTVSSTLEPTTDYGLTVGIAGFGTSTSGVAPRRVCTN